jgi:hypothetical protein
MLPIIVRPVAFVGDENVSCAPALRGQGSLAMQRRFKQQLRLRDRLAGSNRHAEPRTSVVRSGYTSISLELTNEAAALRKAQSLADATGCDVVVTDEEGREIASVSPSRATLPQ